MSDDIPALQAEDIFAYVDLYRRLKVESADYVTKERDRLVDKFWNMQDAPTRYYAQLRAHEHALDWILKRREPKLVVFGQVEDDGRPAASERERQREEQLQKLRDDNAMLARQLKQYQAQEQEWQAQFIEKKQALQRLRRKLGQTQSTSTVVGVTLLVVILIQFGLLLTRP